VLKVCMDYLEAHLKKSGIKSKVYRVLKHLENSNESHIGAVLFEKEEWSRDKRVTLFEKDGVQMKRKKLWNRTTYLSVTIGDYTMEKCVMTFDEFMKTLPKGFSLDDNWVGFTVEGVEWAEDDDNRLKSKVAVQMLIKCDGGMYIDEQVTKVNDIRIEEG